MALVAVILMVLATFTVIQGVTVMDEVMVGVGMVIAIIAFFALLFTGKGEDVD